ncbi:hypothetical protein ACFWWT_39875 [Streptomyces sp. NPDC058676]|uniref:hypothetical protein n=1 Tax=unclassified Streptomyces TaxID=2593676 RepID=UPI00365FA604
MLIGSTCVNLNHRVIRIGATSPPDDVLDLGGTPLVAGPSHVQVRARAQVGLVRVRLWIRTGPLEGSCLFAGTLSLGNDGAIAVGDVTGVSRYTCAVVAPGAHDVRVHVDDPGAASRIDVILDSGDEEVTLEAVGGYPLPKFTTVPGSVIGKEDRLGLVLSAHDLPVNRLASAVKLLGLAAEEDDPARREVARRFRIRLVCEWLRWLSPDVSVEKSTKLGEYISERLSSISMSNPDARSLEISSEVVQRALLG